MDMATLCAVHGNIALSLRHPMNNGPSSFLMIDLEKHIETLLLDNGVFTKDEIEFIHKREKEELQKIYGEDYTKIQQLKDWLG